MKFLLLSILFLLSISYSEVKIYYFHGEFRCDACNKIEKYTKETVYDKFSKEIDKGDVTFKSINAQQEENTHYNKKYDLYTQSVILSKIINKKEKFLNLEKVWDYVEDEKKFKAYITDEIKSFMK